MVEFGRVATLDNRTQVRYDDFCLLEMRVCVQCGRTFRPSSRHLRCPSCRSRDTCSCGRPKQRRSRTCSRCRPTGREFNGYWKGGRTKHKAGYVTVRVENHPRGGANGYVFEHILVMEEILGRHLSSDETVTGTACEMTTALGILNFGSGLSRLVCACRMRSSGHARSCGATRGWTSPPGTLPTEGEALLEVAGIEPASPGDRLGLLRAQPAVDLIRPLPQAEGRRTSLASMSRAGHEAHPAR